MAPAFTDALSLPGIADYSDDALTAAGLVRAPTNQRRAQDPARRIVIIGGGPGAIIAAIRLKQAGFEDIQILEKASQIGGTWNHNRYPGCGCDVQSQLYSFSFAMNPHWSRAYAPQGEILTYLQDVADAHGVTPLVQLNAEVTGAHWNAGEQSWTVTVAGQADVQADILISAVGMFNEPKTPNMAGLDSFAGRAWHSARWPEDGDLTGQRVAILGSGATAVQLVPAAAEIADQVVSVIRSPQWLLPRDDRAVPQEEQTALSAAPQGLLAARRELFQALEGLITYGPEVRAFAANAAQKNLNVVEDPQTRAGLTPDVPWGCHRPLITSTFYPAFNRPNVQLVTDPIVSVVPEGLKIASGHVHEVDRIVFCTGFETTRYASTLAIQGRDGQSLQEAWSGGAQAYLGVHSPGFPNFFQLYGPNTNVGSIFYVLECQVEHVTSVLQRMDVAGAQACEVKPAISDAYDRWLQGEMDKFDLWQAGCSNYYRNEHGRVVTQWPGTMKDYRRHLLSAAPDALALV